MANDCPRGGARRCRCCRETSGKVDKLFQRMEFLQRLVLQFAQESAKHSAWAHSQWMNLLADPKAYREAARRLPEGSLPPLDDVLGFGEKEDDK